LKYAYISTKIEQVFGVSVGLVTETPNTIRKKSRKIRKYRPAGSLALILKDSKGVRSGQAPQMAHK
jgi:hypothetical protein